MIAAIKAAFYPTLYRWIMQVAHYYNWHYAPPIYPDGDTQLWCKWCGFRETVKKGPTRKTGGIGGVEQRHTKVRTV